MPIEIKELYIKINVNDTAQSNANPNKQSGGKEDDMIQQCLEQVAIREQRKKER